MIDLVFPFDYDIAFVILDDDRIPPLFQIEFWLQVAQLVVLILILRELQGGWLAVFHGGQFGIDGTDDDEESDMVSVSRLAGQITLDQSGAADEENEEEKDQALPNAKTLSRAIHAGSADGNSAGQLSAAEAPTRPTRPHPSNEISAVRGVSSKPSPTQSNLSLENSS